jgi:outer membrane protein
MDLKRFMRSSLLIVLLLLLAGALPMKAQMKIGYMNPQTVLDTLPAKQQVEKQLSSFVEQKRGELEQQTVRFQKRISTLQQQAQNASQSRQQMLQDSANSINSQLRQYRMKVQQQIQQRRARLLRPIYTRIDKAIQAVAERKNLEFVLNESTSNGQNIIYYANAQQLNITEEVIDQLLQNNNSN